MRFQNILLLFLAAIAIGFITTSGILYSGGSPGGKTRSPGDVSTCTQCHGGIANPVTGWITTNVPPTGYIPGNTYNVTVTATQSGISKFGFECTAEDAFASKVGTFIILMGAQTKLANNNHPVTHKAAGTSATGGSKSWAFAWTAPATGTGVVTFYAAFNAANGNNSTTGDIIYKSNLAVQESPPNNPPYFVSNPVVEATVGQTYSYSIEADDMDGNTNLTISCPTKPIWLVFSDIGNGVALLMGTPQTVNVGTHSVELQVSDGMAPAVNQNFTITVQTNDVQVINLPLGWGIYSTYIAPIDSSVPAVFSQIIDSISIVKDGVGNVYWPQFGVNLIGSLSIGQGYQIKTLFATSLSISGTAVVPETSPIGINQGWNLIAYLRQSQAQLVQMMSSVSSTIIIMKNGAGNVYWPQFGVNTIVNLVPGMGYQLKQSSAATLYYPPN